MFEDFSKMYIGNVCFFTKQFHVSFNQCPHHKFIEHTTHVHTYLHTNIPIIPTNCMDPRPANSQLSGDDVGNHKNWCLPTYLPTITYLPLPTYLPTYLQLDACIFTNKNTLNATIYLIASLRYWA